MGPLFRETPIWVLVHFAIPHCSKWDCVYGSKFAKWKLLFFYRLSFFGTCTRICVAWWTVFLPTSLNQSQRGSSCSSFSFCHIFLSQNRAWLQQSESTSRKDSGYASSGIVRKTAIDVNLDDRFRSCGHLWVPAGRVACSALGV